MGINNRDQIFPGLIGPVLVLLGAGLLVPQISIARSNTGKTILETIGISAAVGTVLGASSLPFYDQPGDHLNNMAIGAGAGAAVGVGVLVYGLFRGASSEEGYARESGVNPPLQFACHTSEFSNFELGQRSNLAKTRSVPHASYWMPLISLNW